jgi:elongation factor 1-gamma
MAQKQPTPFAILHTPPTFIHARVTKILAAAYLNDLTIVIPEDFAYGVTNKSPEFLAKFPMGKIPALETASGFLLAEGSAIAYYLADSGPKREQLLGKTPEERALVQMWCGLADSEIFPNMGLVVGPMLTGSPYDAKVVAEKEEAYLRALKRVELHLKGGEKMVDWGRGAESGGFKRCGGAVLGVQVLAGWGGERGVPRDSGVVYEIACSGRDSKGIWGSAATV